MNAKYNRQWEVPSSSNPAKKYRVSRTIEGRYECSCPRWCTHMPREDCKHIRAVKDGDFDVEDTIQYELAPSNVGRVKKVAVNKFAVPLIPFSDDGVHILATICYDLMSYGVPWSQVKARYGNAMGKGGWKRLDIIAHVESYGRAVYTEWIQGQGWTNLQFLPVSSVMVLSD